MKRFLHTIIVSLAASACDRLPNSENESGSADPSDVVFESCHENACLTKLYLTGLGDDVAYDTFASESHALGMSSRSVKFLIDNREDTPKIFFINSNFKDGEAAPSYAELHYDFARFALRIPEDPAEYNQVTYFDNNKRYFAGALNRYNIGGIESYAVEFFPQDVINEETVMFAMNVVARSIGMRDHPLSFVATGSQQTTQRVAQDFTDSGYLRRSIDELLGSATYLPLHMGEAYGYLRLFPVSQELLRPTDIVVFDELPLDLSVVGGVITKAYQDSNSHVNLKSKERNTPNMVLRDASLDNPLLSVLANKPVKLVVSRDGFTVTLISEDEVEARYAERMNKPWKKLPKGSMTDLVSFDDMCSGLPETCFDLAASYGGKATNLGFLSHPFVLGRTNDKGSFSNIVGYDVSPLGFAVPTRFYEDFLADPANKELREKIAILVRDEREGKLSPKERRTRSLAIQDLFMQGRLPAGQLDAIYAKIGETLPGIKAVKVRSSANAEDVAGFNGAGLYESYRAATAGATDGSCAIRLKATRWGAMRQKVYPATIACAVKGVYASLWNPRAIDERTFARINHTDAAMGLAIVPVYDHDSKIKANSVVVTRVLGTDTLAGYGISVQEKNNLVTNPAPPTYAEETVAMFLGSDAPTSFTIKRYARPYADDAPLERPVLARAESEVMVEIAKAVELAYCSSRPDYYVHPAGEGCRRMSYNSEKPRALDLEFKLLENGKFVCKQVREFHGAP